MIKVIHTVLQLNYMYVLCLLPKGEVQGCVYFLSAVSDPGLLLTLRECDDRGTGE